MNWLKYADKENWHEAAQILPRMNEEEFAQLTTDISTNGFNPQFPIVLYKDKVLDGINRILACKKANVKPEFTQYAGDSPVTFVITANINRRHLSKSQSAVCAVEAIPLFEKETLAKQAKAAKPLYGTDKTAVTLLQKKSNVTPSESTDKNEKAAAAYAGKMFSVSRSYVAAAKALPISLQAEVKAGKKTVNEAKKEVKKVKAKAAAKKAATDATGTATLYHEGYDTFLKRFEDKSIDLLLTDPPFSTDVDDIKSFAKWLPKALAKVNATGRAFVFIGAYPEELQAYLNTALPTQVLVWAYNNTIGATPKKDHMQNWQACLYFRNEKAPDWNEDQITNLFAAQTVNAPDGRQGEGKYHSWEKPMPLIKNIISRSTKAGGVVIDPFAGSGTHLLAAKLLGRTAFGCDVDKKAVKISVDRGVALGE